MESIASMFSQVNGKRVLVRTNYDVPLENGVVQDTTRLEDSVETIKSLRSNGATVILLAHAGRPDGEPKPEYSLKPIAQIVTQLIGEPVTLIEYQADFNSLKIEGQGVFLLENLRYWKEEEENSPEFSQKLATLGDMYVNESFAVCHRAHASIVGIPKYLPSYAGLSLMKEMEILAKIRTNPDHPFVVVLGGAKLETKEPLVKTFAQSADKILVGGKIAVDLKSKGEAVGANVVLAELTEDTKDITEKSAREFADIIISAKTVVWNGTMGVFEEPEHAQGTKIVAEAINTTAAFTLAGGGDTETALTELNMESGIDHISTGGGAMLTYFTDGKLVGTEALTNE